jgi:hypothetical protein
MIGRLALILRRWIGFAKIVCQKLRKKKMNKIIVPDAAIREFNEKYGKYLPKPSVPVIDEDAMYLKYMMGETNEKK